MIKTNAISEDRLPASKPRRLPALVLLLASVASPLGFAGEKHPVSFAEPRPDKALVYFIRTGRMTGGARTMFVYADQTFLGVIDNGSYGFAYVDPGRHLIWTNWTVVTRELDLVPGETYYLEVWKDVAVVDEERGKALISKVGELVTATAREVKTSASHIRNRYSDAVDNEALKEKAPVGEVDAPPAPEHAEGMLRIPAYTTIELELLESVTSEFSPPGSPVHFRVAEDASVDGHVFVRQGTPVEGVVREAEQAGGLGKAGVLEIVVPFLQATDGTKLPLVAQLAPAGKGREDVVAGFQLGLLPGLAVRGREAFCLAGDLIKARTRGEAWVQPGSDPGAAERPRTEAAGGASTEDSTTAAAVVLEARGPDSVHFNPHKGYRPDDLKILLASPVEPSEAQVHAVGGLPLPYPVKPSRIARARDGWECVFDGWSVVRFMRPGYGQSALPIDVRGRLADGRPFAASVAVDFLIEQ